MIDTYQDCRWLSLSSAAKYIDASPDTVNRRGIPWQEKTVPGRLRWKFLKLGPNTRMERRYFRDDLDALLVTA